MTAFLESATAFSQHPLWHTAGWTMLHFLWLGTALLILGWTIRRILRRANPNVRYTTSLVLLALLAALPLTACGIALKVESQETRVKGQRIVESQETRVKSQTMASPEIIELKSSHPDFVPLPQPPGESFAAPLISTEPATTTETIVLQHDWLRWELHEMVGWLPWLWLVGTPISFLLLLTGLVGTERLRRAGTLVTDGRIHDACERLQQSLGVTRRVGIAISERVATPILVGIVRPLVLLPPSAVTGWTMDELEMVLLHELAHVRRWDNLVNLLQRVVESLLFFHPAVWIVSRWVRLDREECCDAVVVRHTNAPEAYANLLLDLATKQPLAGLAMAQPPLATRIRRILKMEDEPMRVSRNTVLLLGSMFLALTIAITFASVQPMGAEEGVVEASDRSAEELESVDELRTDDEALEEDESEVLLSIVYGEVDRLGIDVIDWLQTIQGLGHVKQAITEENSIVISATREAHDKIQEFLGQRRIDSPFPTLEQQKTADVAYKILGFELEKLSEEELERVKAMGYEGGLLIANAQGHRIKNGDFLVGLHAWPTRSFDELNAILSRDDLDELAPLKFYVISQVPHELPQESPFEVTKFEMKDHVITGRLEVDLTAWRQLMDRKAAIGETPVADAPGSPEGEPELRYDGMTFDEWRRKLFSELKIESRIEAIQAITAFGRAGMGEEAAGVIIELAGQYDFSHLVHRPVADIYDKTQGALTGSDSIPTKDWLPQMVSILEANPELWGEWAEVPIMSIRSTDPKVTASLKSIANNTSLPLRLRGAAIYAMLSDERNMNDEEIVALAREALASKSRSHTSGEELTFLQVVLLALNFKGLDIIPEQMDCLFHESERVRELARNQLHNMYHLPHANEVVSSLLQVLDREENADTHQFALAALWEMKDGIKLNPVLRAHKADVVERMKRIESEGDESLRGYAGNVLHYLDPPENSPVPGGPPVQ